MALQAVLSRRVVAAVVALKSFLVQQVSDFVTTERVARKERFIAYVTRERSMALVPLQVSDEVVSR